MNGKRTFKKKSYFILPILFSLFLNNLSAQKKPVYYVNVFTGTSNSRWMMFPGATLPFGMVKLRTLISPQVALSRTNSLLELAG